MQISNVDTSGTNGSGAVVQVVSGQTSSSVNTFSVALAAFSDPGNGTVGGFAEAAGSVTFTPGSGYVLMDQVNTTDTGMALATEYRINPSTLVDMSSNALQSWFAIGAEIKAGVATASGESDPGMMLSFTPEPDRITVW
jgi:hypothetical protein